MIEFISSPNLVPYQKSLTIMDELNKKTNNTIWFLEHYHVYTLGNRGKYEDIKNIYKIPIYKSKRGGEVTYHGPGQLVVYFVLNLKRLNKDIRQFIHDIEDVVINLLSIFKINAHRDKHPGIWANNKKIASIGFYVRNFVALHGFALNINPDLDYFKNIVPCGLKDIEITSLKELNIKTHRKEVENLLKDLLIKKFFIRVVA